MEPPPDPALAEPPTEPPTEPPADPTAEPSAEPVGNEPEDGNFFTFIHEQFGEDLRGKFPSEYEAIRSLVEASRLVGKRDEDAIAYRQLEEQAGSPEKLAAVLAGQTANKPDPPAAKLMSLDLLQSKEAQLAHAAKTGESPPSGLEAEVRTAREEINRRLFMLLKDAPALLEMKAKIEEMPQAIDPQAIQAQLGEIQERAASERWAAENKQALFVNGETTGELSDIGKRVVQLHDELETKGVPNRLDRLGLALRLAQAEQPKPRPVRAPSQRAVRQPAVAAAPADEPISAGEFFKQGEGKEFGLAAYHIKGPGKRSAG